MKRPTIFGAFGLIVAASLAMPSAFAQTTLRLACPSAPTNPTCMTAQYFADETERLTDGSVIVDVFPSAQLGRGAEAINQTSAGIIDLVVEDIPGDHFSCLSRANAPGLATLIARHVGQAA